MFGVSSYRSKNFSPGGATLNEGVVGLKMVIKSIIILCIIILANFDLKNKMVCDFLDLIKATIFG